MKTIINGTYLLNIGYEQGPALGTALELLQHPGFTAMETADVLALLKAVKQQPESYLNHSILQSLATRLVEAARTAANSIALVTNTVEYTAYGAELIEDGARKQMATAMKLPITVAGALMPDAHQGYGLPIGGVLATRNAIIPYGVGVDIGCRMALTIFDIPQKHFLENTAKYKRELIAQTKFGAGAGFHGRYKADHAVMEREEFNLTPFIKQLHEKAWSQLGSSGGGNHFVEFGMLHFAEKDEALNIDAGAYLALLTHSGSRGLGATIAGYYTRLAKELCKLPQEAAHLAYLDMNTAAGQEYWLAMNLAGDYAAACHAIIHRKIAQAVGGQVLGTIENHHNFAWKETWKGEDVIVHRKGATPAGKGVMGIIPGSMAAPGFLVRGKGDVMSINSASHGAGRQMSRTKAIKEISKADFKAVLKAHEVTLIGAGLDEAPMAYKDIHTVMAAQQNLVDVVATFTPKMVRMADDGSRED